LRHQDFFRYRRYCTRRLHRLCKALKFLHGNKRYKKLALPEDCPQRGFLEYVCTLAERAWALGMQLKMDNAAASTFQPRWRHHSIQRMRRAATWARDLHRFCEAHGDARTQLHSACYLAYMEGLTHLERDEHEEALQKLIKCHKACDHLALASGDPVVFRAKVQELLPMERVCRFHLGISDTAQGESGKAVAQVATSELRYRGRFTVAPSQELTDRLRSSAQQVASFSVEKPENNDIVIECYGEICGEWGELLRNVHGEMILKGAEAQTDGWHKLEAMVREHKMVMNIERNLLLLANHFRKLDSVQDISCAEARKTCKPEEGLRYCDLLLEDFGTLQELPGNDEDEAAKEIDEGLAAYAQVMTNCRCLFLSLCYMGIGKLSEAVALMDMLHSRVESEAVPVLSTEPLSRLKGFVEKVSKPMFSNISRWCVLGRAALCIADAAKEGEADGANHFGGKGFDVDEIVKQFAFPMQPKPMLCKPLLLDIAHHGLTPPDLEQLVQEQSQGRLGVLSRMTSRLWGSK